MGLDITAYRKLTPAPDAPRDDDNYVTADGFVEFSDAVLVFTEKHFPGRTQGLTAGVYSYAECVGFRAGSYSGYSAWRDWLAKVAGYRSAEAVWDDPSLLGPFVELINFADNEGVIGPVVAAKLAKDFAENCARIAARTPGAEYDLQLYRQWLCAFELAAQDGAVEFH